MKVLTGITSLDTPVGRMSGAPGLSANPEKLQRAIDAIKYPIPRFEVVILPFILDQIGGRTGIADGVADYANSTIYLSAYHRLEPNSEYWREINWLKTLMHEIGHLVHYAYLPPPSLGEPTGLWRTFRHVHKLNLANSNYFNSLEECFAESWRLMFAPQTQVIPHKQGLTSWTLPDVHSWMKSLDGSVVIRIGQLDYFQGGEIKRIGG